LIKDQGITDNLRSEHLSKQAYALKESTDVLIVGGGVVGVELAGEIAAKYGDKNITIVHNGSNL
jgi:NADH dehydrogenase FAD-containing subunit